MNICGNDFVAHYVRNEWLLFGNKAVQRLFKSRLVQLELDVNRTMYGQAVCTKVDQLIAQLGYKQRILHELIASR